jgi:hypothetical protein
MNMRDPYMADGSDLYFSLSKLTGKKVVDILGYPADPFGGTPLFQISHIVFEDGTTVFVEGEHDVAYIPAQGDEDDDLANLNEDTLQDFLDEEQESEP